MKYLIKVITWLKVYWYIPLAFLAFLLLWIFFSRSQNPIEKVQKELEVIKEKAEVQKRQELEGLEVAKEIVLKKYEEKIQELNEQQQKHVKELENDPIKLSAFLVRVSGK